MSNPKKKIAYFTFNDPLDKRSWSGTTYYLGQALQNHVGDVFFLGPVKIPWILDKIFRALQKISRFIFKKEWIPKYSLLKNIYAARVLKKRMRGHVFDFIFAPAAAPELAFLKTKTPMIYFGDSTFKLYSEAYTKEFHNVSLLTKWEGEYLEKRSLRKSSLVILTSQWAAGSARADYGVPAKKLEILLLGANIDYIPNYQTIFEKKENQTLTLLFLAVDWDRKGGSIAFDTLLSLHSRGIKSKLVVCGCIPPPDFNHPDIKVIPFINKNVPAEYAHFVNLLSAVHFLIMPTRADCSLLVAMEANSYGIPVITSSVGGVPDVVKNGDNGYCLPLSAGGTLYADKIDNIFSDAKRYHNLICSSRKRFDEHLNWNIWAEKFATILEEHHL